MSELFFKAPATIKKIQSMSDRSYRLIVDTERELEPAQAAALNMMLMSTGQFGFVTKENQADELDKLEIPEEVLEPQQKSFSQRARSIAFLIWENKGQKEDFETFWSGYKERILSSMKKALPPREDR